MAGGGYSPYTHTHIRTQCLHLCMWTHRLTRHKHKYNHHHHHTTQHHTTQHHTQQSTTDHTAPHTTQHHTQQSTTHKAPHSTTQHHTQHSTTQHHTQHSTTHSAYCNTHVPIHLCVHWYTDRLPSCTAQGAGPNPYRPGGWVPQIAKTAIKCDYIRPYIPHVDCSAGLVTHDPRNVMYDIRSGNMQV